MTKLTQNQLGFRPLTGIKVSEQNESITIDLSTKGFRPLTGIKVSELF